MKGLILAAGHGTRLRPLTYSTNKHLIPLANRPLIEYGIEALKNSGITDIGIIVGHTDERVQEIKNVLGDGSKYGVKFTYIFQDAPRGLAHAVKVAQSFLTENNPDRKFVVHLGDNIIKGGINDFVSHFKNSQNDALVLFRNVPDPQRFGVAEFENGKLIRVIEKPRVPPTSFALVGVYFFTDAVFPSIDKLKPSWRNEYEITEAIQNLIDIGKVDYKIIEKSWWKDPGDPSGIIEANHLILDDLESVNKGIIENGVTVIGKVRIEEGAVIKNSSVVKGPAVIGTNSVVDSAYIGPYSSIGNNVVVKGAEIESSIIMDGARIECKKRIIDSLIGKDATISDSTTTPSGLKLVLGERSNIRI